MRRSVISGLPDVRRGLLEMVPGAVTQVFLGGSARLREINFFRPSNRTKYGGIELRTVRIQHESHALGH